MIHVYMGLYYYNMALLNGHFFAQIYKCEVFSVLQLMYHHDVLSSTSKMYLSKTYKWQKFVLVQSVCLYFPFKIKKVRKMSTINNIFDGFLLASDVI